MITNKGEDMNYNSIKAVVLAGGSGTRLWPLSRQQLPKQFLKLNGDESMLGATISRLSPLVERSDAWVITGEKHATGEAFSELDGLHLILEPCGRNTAPAIAVAAAVMLDFNKDDPVMIVLPSDHLITKKEAFQKCLKQAIEVAMTDQLVTFGLVPDAPETGFGYVQAEPEEGAIHKVLRFVEKPNIAAAEQMLEEGGYYWNSGMFVWKCSVILEEVKQYLPSLWTVLERMRARWQTGEPWQEVVRDSFADMPDVSIDYGVMEKSKRVSLVAADIGWSDVGSWDAVHEMAKHDEDGNEISGNVLAIDCKNSLLRSEGRLLAAIGLEDIIAVETPDAILLARAGQSQRVKEIVGELVKTKGTLHLEHVTVRRPWGSYTVLENSGQGYKLKRIDVLPGGRLSLQSHQHRAEHWVVVSGTATITCGDLTRTVPKNGGTYIPIGEVHRLENRGKMPLQLIEVQVGDYLGEDDIERFEDSYGRKK
ncbi:mannose-1-phosphate guanylyltransferase/mannose-6-phosphate isomerase [Mariprofundus ferrooxydans]|uniref:mannose-1-phosphate guanylyltransferase n=1 Tax=Mariprofundus ferrooxydans PV-1 TaxID=314345 RepID=Q0EZ10_9PROT|nr:phosphomannose isomerase / GDPmannose dehydrogenase [Mariprofundus ferrooxydans PV-1]KON48779.1 phosphoheptose isomerase [Mariprofundus ferrooxydans]